MPFQVAEKFKMQTRTSHQIIFWLWLWRRKIFLQYFKFDQKEGNAKEDFGKTTETLKFTSSEKIAGTKKNTRGT